MIQNQQQPMIYSKIVAVMRALGALTKSQKNQQQGYGFRGIDDVYNHIHEHLAREGVFTTPEVLEDRSEDRTTKNGHSLIYRILKMKYTFYAEDGSSVYAITMGEGMDSGDKASNKAMSVAQKYAFVQTFSIPTKDLKDPDFESEELKEPYIYNPTSDEHKLLLAKVLNAHSITDKDLMVNISNSAHRDGAKTTELENYVKLYLNLRYATLKKEGE